MKQTLSATVTVSASVTLTPQANVMIRERLEESLQITKQIAELEARHARLKDEVRDLCAREGVSDEMLDEGIQIGDYRFKRVRGNSSRLDKMKLIELGCAPEWITEATKKTPKRPYLRVSLGKDSDEGHWSDDV